MCPSPQVFCWRCWDVTAPSSLLHLLQEETEQPTVSYSFWQANPFGRVSPVFSSQTPQGLSSYSQIPTCNQLQSQTLQPWDSSSRLSGQHNQPPKAQALCSISGSMISSYIFHTVPASFSKWVKLLTAPISSSLPVQPQGPLCSHMILSLC